MGSGFSSRSPVRWLAALAAIGAMWWVAFEHHERIPILTYLNLGIHQGGHMLTYSASELTNSLAGSIAQVLVGATPWRFESSRPHRNSGRGPTAVRSSVAG